LTEVVIRRTPGSDQPGSVLGQWRMSARANRTASLAASNSTRLYPYSGCAATIVPMLPALMGCCRPFQGG
jgi:hypothetical protein